MQDSHPEAQELQPPRIEPLPVCPAGQRQEFGVRRLPNWHAEAEGTGEDVVKRRETSRKPKEAELVEPRRDWILMVREEV